MIQKRKCTLYDFAHELQQGIRIPLRIGRTIFPTYVVPEKKPYQHVIIHRLRLPEMMYTSVYFASVMYDKLHFWI